MNNINIIIEGCDCTGKTTIAKYLSEKYGFEYNKINAPQNKYDAIREYASLIEKLNNNRGFIYDRAHLGETVYAPIIRGYDIDNIIFSMEELLLDHNYLFVIDSTEKNVQDRFDGKFIKRTQIKRVLDGFISSFDKSLIKNKFIIDNNEDISVAIINIEEIINGIYN